MEGRQLEFYKDLQADAQAAVARAKRERTDIKMDTILTIDFRCLKGVKLL